MNENNLTSTLTSFADAARGSDYYDESTTKSKIDTLSTKRDEKLARLGTQSQQQDLAPGTYTQLDTGTLESNANKIWNDESSAGIQSALSDAANMSIHTRPDGSKYQIDPQGFEKDFTGQTRRAYMYGTKDDSGAVKFGLARGDLPSSDYRYQPGRAEEEGFNVGKNGYGYEPGDDGVDINKNYMDMELPYEVATALEGMVHGRKDALANRQFPDYLSDKALQHASGVSEYYTSPEGMLGDSRNQDVPATSNLMEYSKLEGAQPTYVDRKQAMVDALAPENPYNQLRGMASSGMNVLTKIRGLIGEGVQSLGEADQKYLEGEQARLDKYYTGEKVAPWRKDLADYFKEVGTEVQKEATAFQLNNTANRISGYSTKDVDELSQEVSETIKTEGYIPAFAKAVTDVRALEVLTNSLPEMFALGLSVGGMAVVNVNNNINIGEAKLGREFTTREKVLSSATSIVSTYLDRVGDKLALNGMNPAKSMIKTVVSKAPQAVKDKLASTFGKSILSISEAPLRLAGAAAVEGVTEYGQTLGETAAQRPTVFKEGFTSAEMEEADVAGVLGAAMGGHMAIPSNIGAIKGIATGTQGAIEGLASKVAQGRVDKATAINDARVQEEVDTAESVLASKGNEYGGVDAPTVAALTTLLQKDTINEPYTPEEQQIVDNAIADGTMENVAKNLKSTVDGKLLSPTDLKATVSNDKEYVQALNTEKAKVVSSIFDIDTNGKIVGLNDEATNLSSSELATKFDEAVSWMRDYSDAFKVGEETKNPYALNETTYFLEEGSKLVNDHIGSQPMASTEVASNRVDEALQASDFSTEFTDASIEDKGNIVDKFIDTTYGEGAYKAPEFKAIKDSIIKKYSVSGFAASEVDWKAEFTRLADESGVKGESRGKSKSQKFKRNENINNQELDTVLSGNVKALVGDKVGEDSKTINQVVEALNTDERVTVLKDLSSTLNNIVSKAKDTAGKLFKSGDREGNLKRAMVLGLNVINAQAKSDTAERRSVSPVEGNSNYDILSQGLKQDEYWAGRASVAEQIGKDYATSYDIQLTGTPEQLYKRYRQIGDEILKLMEDEGLVEVAPEKIWTKLSDKVTLGDKSTKGGAKSFEFKEVMSIADGKKSTVYKDTGIRIKGTTAMENTSTGNLNDYSNAIGDVAKRVAQLLVPSKILVPFDVAPNEPLVVDPSTKLFSPTGKKESEKTLEEKKADEVSIIKALHKKPLRMKASSLKMLKIIKGLIGNKTLGQVIKKHPWVGSLIGKLDTGAKLLKLTEEGTNYTNLQNLSDLLDNLDVFQDEDGNPKDVFFNYQTDVNDRKTLLQTVANFQSDKVLARRIFTSGEPTEVSGVELDLVIQAVIQELGLLDKNKATAGDYAKLIKDIKDENKDTGNKQLDRLIWVMNANIDRESADWYENRVESASWFDVKPAEFIGLLEAFEEVYGRGNSAKSSYMVEFDASASGVVNTMVNIVGRDEDGKIKELLLGLGISLDGTTWTVESLTDAYNMLADKVWESVLNGTTPQAATLRARIELLKEAGVNIRELAKPVVMTWFYSAGKESISNELSNSVLKSLVMTANKEGSKGTAARKVISDILDSDTIYSKRAINNIAPNSAEHVKLMESFRKLGEMYYSKLDATFPKVNEYKEDMATIHNALVKSQKGLKKDYWQGTIRNAFAAMNSKDREMLSSGITSIYKNKLKGVEGWTDDELALVTEKMANLTSIMPLHAHNIDAAQLLTALAEVVFDKDSEGVMTVHDAIYGKPATLLKLQGAYNKAVIDAALKYDMLDNMILAAENVVSKMKEAITNGEDSDGSIAINLAELEKVASTMKVKNDKFIEKKEAVLKGASANVFGVMDSEKVKEGTVPIAETSVVESITDTETSEVATSNPFDVPSESAVALDTFITEPNIDNVKSLLLAFGELVRGNDERVTRIIGDLESKKTPDIRFEKHTAKSDREYKQDGKHSYVVMEGNVATVYIGESIDSSGNINQVIDELAHEVEHAVSDKYIDSMKSSDAKTQKMYQVLEAAIGKIREWKPTGQLTYAERRVKNIKDITDTHQAIKELVALYNGEKSIQIDVMNVLADPSKVGLSGMVEKVLKLVREGIDKLISGIMAKDLKDVSLEDTVAAAEYVAREARTSGNVPTDITNIDVSNFESILDNCKI